MTSIVEDSLRLSVHRVVMAARRRNAPIRWQWMIDDKVTSSISLSVTLTNECNGTLELRYHCHGEPVHPRWPLQAMPCRLGGVRWYVRRSGQSALAAKLYCFGHLGFHPRQAYSFLFYRSQIESRPNERALQRRDRILTQKLKSNDPDFVMKPKWMRWRTYHKLMRELDHAQQACEAWLCVMMRRPGSFL